MTDELAGQQSEGIAPAETPALPADDIEARLTAKFEDRIKGFQRMVAEKDAALRAAQQEAMNLRMSGMSEDEKAELEWTQLQDQVRTLQQENALLQLQSEYPEELPVFKKLLSADNPKDQLEAIRALRLAAQSAQAASQPQASPTAGEPEIPDVDPNNPPMRPAPSGSGPSFNGVPITEDWADRLLASVKRMR